MDATAFAYTHAHAHTHTHTHTHTHKHTHTHTLTHKHTHKHTYILIHSDTHKEEFAEKVTYTILKSLEKNPERLQKSARQSKPKQLSKQKILPMKNKTLKKTQKFSKKYRTESSQSSAII